MRMMRDKSRPPSVRGYKGVRRRWSNARGCWTFRACIQERGQRTWGNARLSREQAADDYRTMALRVQDRPLRVLTLQDATRAVIADARGRGLPESTVRHSYEAHAKWLLAQLGADTMLVDVDLERVQSLVRAALAAGRSSTTLVQKDLPLLDRAFVHAGVPSVVPDVRKRMAAQLKVVPKAPRFLQAEDLRRLLERMRSERFSDKHGNVVELPGRQADADLCEFVAATGVRAGELGRVLTTDVELDRGVVRVRLAKDRAHPRDLVVPASVRPVVERLLERARALQGSGRNPGGLLVPNAVWWLGNIGRRWQRRLGDRRLCARTLRHTFVTGVIAAGATATQARDLAGHRHLSTTDRYAHAIGTERAAVAGRWCERWCERPAGTG